MNPECGAEARVPLSDQPKVDVGYEYLLELEKEEGDDYSFRPEGAKRKYSVKELLEGVRHMEQKEENKRGDIYIMENRGSVVMESLNTQTNINNSLITNQEKPQTKQWSWSSISAAVALFITSICFILLWGLVEEWRWIAVAVFSIFTIVFVVIQYFNPDLFFRRWLGILILPLTPQFFGLSGTLPITDSLVLDFNRTDPISTLARVVVVLGVLLIEAFRMWQKDKSES